MKYEKILIVYKTPVLELYKSKNKELEKMILEEGLDVKDLEAELEEDKEARKVVEETLGKDKDVKVDWKYRGELSKNLVKKYDLIMTFGGDGTLMEASHYISNKPVFGINSDYRPEADSSEGFFLAANKHNFPEKYKQLQEGKLKQYKFNRLQLELNGKKLEELVLNDVLVVHKHPAATSRMVLKKGNLEEFQKSSGTIIATAASNWAIKAGGKALPIEGKEFQYVTRELYIGRLNPNPKMETGTASKLEVFSKMREGMLYIDGKHIEHPFGLGAKLKVYPGKPLKILGFNEENRKKYYVKPQKNLLAESILELYDKDTYW
ncbi:hypothetical protein FJZ53_01250 [Candidatus Woesearchaeota archaeon]|nr:hypothetical protein [Candidatus Woesearchaeota archaeon]